MAEVFPEARHEYRDHRGHQQVGKRPRGLRDKCGGPEQHSGRDCDAAKAKRITRMRRLNGEMIVSVFCEAFYLRPKSEEQ